MSSLGELKRRIRFSYRDQSNITEINRLLLRLPTNLLTWYVFVTPSKTGLSPPISCLHGISQQQEDFLLPYLTVRETLRYSAYLRLPASTSTAVKNEIVEEVILELG